MTRYVIRAVAELVRPIDGAEPHASMALLRVHCLDCADRVPRVGAASWMSDMELDHTCAIHDKRYHGAASGQCQTFWGAHTCGLDPGHPGDHICYEGIDCPTAAQDSPVLYGPIPPELLR